MFLTFLQAMVDVFVSGVGLPYENNTYLVTLGNS
jgi:hypothetical protein